MKSSRGKFQTVLLFSSSSTLIFVALYHVINVRHVVKYDLSQYKDTVQRGIIHDDINKTSERNVIHNNTDSKINFFLYKQYTQLQDNYDQEETYCITTNTEVIFIISYRMLTCRLLLQRKYALNFSNTIFPN